MRDGQLVIDGWNIQAPTPYSGTISLSAGQKYDLVVEYFEEWGGAQISLSWSSPSTAVQIIPTAQLFTSSP